MIVSYQDQDKDPEHAVGAEEMEAHVVVYSSGAQTTQGRTDCVDGEHSVVLLSARPTHSSHGKRT